MITYLTPQPDLDRAIRRRHRQAKLEREIQAFFQNAGVKQVNLDEMFQELEWPV